MSIIVHPLNTAYRNQGEYNYKLGIEVYDSDDNGNIDFSTPIDITGDVTLMYQDLDGTINELTGSKNGNQAYYVVQDDDPFCITSGSYRYWVKCFNKEIYGPYELKTMLVGEVES